jgi:hypothetical protein
VGGKLLLLFFLSFFCVETYSLPLIDINQETALRIGIKIWHNECNGKFSGLTSWNEGEKFASLGIGHFNWFPNDHPSSYRDGFPQLIKYMERYGVTVPTWLQGEEVPSCPWRTREEFQAALKSPKMQELRQFLEETIPVQAQFMVYRLVSALPKLISDAPNEDRRFLFDQFVRLSSTPRGVYALVDYVNFKGEGVGALGHKKTSWGLLQVVEGMKYAPDELNTLQAFVWSANKVLTQRVLEASPTSHEQRWLAGWRKRLCTYLE